MPKRHVDIRDQVHSPPKRVRPHFTEKVLRGLELAVRAAAAAGAGDGMDEKNDLARATDYLERMRKYREAEAADREAEAEEGEE